jgi:hypothetical protein
VAENFPKQTGEAGGSGDPKEVLRAYIVDIDENLIKKLDNYDERDKFTVPIITGFMEKIGELKAKISQSILDQSGIDEKHFESMLSGLREAEIKLGEARKLREVKGEMTEQCHRHITRAVSKVEQSIKRPRESLK